MVQYWERGNNHLTHTYAQLKEGHLAVVCSLSLSLSLSLPKHVIIVGNFKGYWLCHKCTYFTGLIFADNRLITKTAKIGPLKKVRAYFTYAYKRCPVQLVYNTTKNITYWNTKICSLGMKPQQWKSSHCLPLSLSLTHSPHFLFLSHTHTHTHPPLSMVHCWHNTAKHYYPV